MSYGALRFLYNNLVTDSSMITPSSTAPGVLGGIEKVGTGAASMETGGQYTGNTDRIYTVQCDAAGEIGVATFRWRSTDTAAGTWEASGVTSSSTFVTLEDGIQVKWTAGTGTDLILADSWTFPANAVYGVSKVLDLRRNTEWRTDDLEKVINGAFTSHTENWTPTDCTLASVAGGQSGNCLEITRTGGSQQYALQNLALIAGVSYTVEGYVKSGTSGNEAYEIWLGGGIGTVISDTSSGAWVQFSDTFTASASGATNFLLIKKTSTAGTMLFDEVTVKEQSQIVIDLGSAQSITGAIIQDHNLSDSATIKIQGNASDSWGSPSYDSGALSVTDPLINYTSQSYRYWRFLVSDITNTDGYVRIGEIFLGTYLQLTKVNAKWGTPRIYGYTSLSNDSEVGILDRKAHAKQKRSTLTFDDTLLNADWTSLETMQEALVDVDSTGKIYPLWVHFFYDQSAEDDLFLMDWSNITAFQRQYFRPGFNAGITIELAEVVRARS